MKQGIAKTSTRIGICGLVLLCGIAVAACGSTDSANAPSTTTTTTTTLPIPVQVIGSSPVGSVASIGPIFRVPVVPVPVGKVVPPPPTTGPLGVTNVDKIGFRQIGSGPDLLLIMGQHGTMTWWDPQLLQALAGSFTVTIFDLPGVGYSQVAANAVTVNEDADIAAGLIGALGLEQTTVLGWGLGGQVAMALAERHSGLAAKLVLVDSGPGGKASTAPAPNVTSMFASPTVTTTELSYLMFTKSQELARTAWIGRIGQISPDDIVEQGVTQEANMVAASQSDDGLASGLNRIHVPTLVVYGDADAVYPPANDDYLIAHIAHAKKLAFVDSGYASLFQNSVAFDKAVDAFTRPS